MDHQSEIDKRKYRNWVRGGLAYKYLKQGLEGFADDVVKKEHNRILAAVIHTPGNNCNHCCLRNLQPLHTCKRDLTGKKTCPYGLLYCNCLHGKKQRCPTNICDGIMEEILKSHGSSPPQPYWRNTDIQKWCTEPWEVAKCYINAPGYSDKTKVAEIDIYGLLHVFINNTSLHSHLACLMTGSSNIFTKVRGRRNSIFHSPTMEMENTELTECVDDIIAILEDTTELKMRKDAQQAVKKLNKLKTDDLIITTQIEMEVCREALSTITRMTEELKQLIHDTKEDISMKQADAFQVIDDEIQTALKDALDLLSNNGEIKNLELAIKLIDAKVDRRLDSDYKQRLSKIEDDITAFKDIGNQKKTKKRLEYLENKQKLQDNLVKYYKKYYVNTSLSPLKQQQESINVKDVYVPPEIKVIEEKKDMNRRGGETARNSAEEAEEEHDKILYSTKPDVETNQLDKDRYNRRENQSVNTDKSEPGKNTMKGYHEHFQTKGNKKIYILGNVGTGKSTFCKMMIENWCDAVKSSTNELIHFENGHDATKAVSSDVNRKSEYDNVSQVAQYEFLFYIPLQYMSAFKSDATVEMIKEITRDFTSDSELIDKIFQEDSMRCLIIADSLDEWTPPKEIVRKPHVSYGIPNGDKANDATVITLSRPSGKGILNLEKPEVDLKLQLLGISGDSLRLFIERYISNTQVTNKTYDEFIKKLEIKHIEHVVKTPLILQQLLWLYCNNIDIGKSVCETYCQILNTMCGWSNQRMDERDEDASLTGPKERYLDGSKVDYNNLNPIKSLNRFPRIKKNIPILFRLGKIAFETCTSDKVQTTFGLSNLEMHLSNDDIKLLTDIGILNRCFGQVLEETQFSFSHIYDIEFFAAVHLAIYYSTAQTASTNRDVAALDLLFLRCKLTCDVIQLSNVIKMFCGLSPDIIGSLSKRISSILNEDGHILQHRRNEDIRYHNELIQIQRLMVFCLNECDSDNTTIISLSDLYIRDDEPIPPLHKINPEYVISLSVDFRYTFSEYNKYVKEYVTKCKHMQNMHVSLNPLNQHQRSPFLFAEKVYLKRLRLSYVTDYDIDLSMVNRLQALVLTDCSYIDISYLDTEHLESINIIQCDGFSCFLTASKLTDVYIEKCHGSIDMTSLQSVIQNAAFLRQLTLDSVTDKLRTDSINIDLSRHHHLQKLKIKYCLPLVITGLNTEQLEQVHIVNSDIYGKVCTDTSLPALEFAHTSAEKLSKLYLEDVIVNMTSLVPLLEQAPLQHLTMIRVSDAQQNFEGHLRGVSDQADGEGHLRGVFGNHSDGEGHMRTLAGVQPKVEGRVYVLNLSMQNKLTHLMIESCEQIKISTINAEKDGKQSTSSETLSTGRDQLFSYTEKISENKGTLCKEVKEIGKIVNQDELDRICESRDRKDKLVVQCCESICNMIKSSSEYIIHVYAAYKKENEQKIFFVVTVMWDFDLNENDIGYRIMKRNYGDLSTEGIDISSSREEREQIMSDDGNIKLSACISKYAEELMDNHRYLNVISGSFVRSKNYKPSALCLSKQNCMALYVLVKGFIPIEENAFQNTYDGVAVDIREGLFFPYGTAREYHDDIKMGCKITRYTGRAGDFGGTLGGFIDHPSYGVCGITCAHALMFPDELKKCVEHNGEISWPKIFSSDIVCQPNPVPDNRNEIGRIVQAIYKEGDQSEAGVEVAVIQIEDRPPISGHFPGIGPNGINIPYTFETGKTCGVSRVLGKDLFKFGCISDFTQGRIKSTPACARTFEFEHNGFTIRLLNQLEIETEKFATHGDSGSLVFCKGISGDIECVGMVEGGVSYKTCIITPIQSILAALKVSSLKEFEIKKTKHQLDSIENRVSHIETQLDSMHSLLRSLTQNNSNDQVK